MLRGAGTCVCKQSVSGKFSCIQGSKSMELHVCLQQDGQALNPVRCVPAPFASLLWDRMLQQLHSSRRVDEVIMWLAFLQVPQPSDARLSLEAAGGEILAVATFEGSATREATDAAVARLSRALEAGS